LFFFSPSDTAVCQFLSRTEVEVRGMMSGLSTQVGHCDALVALLVVVAVVFVQLLRTADSIPHLWRAPEE